MILLILCSARQNLENAHTPSALLILLKSEIPSKWELWLCVTTPSPLSCLKIAAGLSRGQALHRNQRLCGSSRQLFSCMLMQTRLPEEVKGEIKHLHEDYNSAYRSSGLKVLKLSAVMSCPKAAFASLAHRRPASTQLQASAAVTGNNYQASNREFYLEADTCPPPATDGTRSEQ